MKYLTMIALGAMTLALAACDSKEQPGASETPRDVRWYRSHKEELNAKFEECINDPGRLGQTPNCINAQRAKAMGIFSSENKVVPRIQ